MRHLCIFCCFVFMWCSGFRLAAQEHGTDIQAQNPDTRLLTLQHDTLIIGQQINASKNYDSDTALTLLQAAFRKSSVIGYRDGAARALLGLGTYYFQRGQLDRSMSFFRQAVPYCEYAFFSREKLLVNLYNNIAANYTVRGLPDSGIHYFYRSVKLLENQQRPDSAMLAHLYTNLAGAWLMTDQIGKARYYLQKSEAISLKTNNFKELVLVYSNLAAAWSALDRKTAAAFAQKALRLLERYPDKAAEQNVLYTLGNIHTMDHNPGAALPYFLKALAISSPNPIEGVLKPNLGLSNAWLQLNKPELAEDCLLRSLAVAEQAGLRDKATFFIYSNLADVYHATGDDRKAYDFRTKAFLLEDSLLNAEKLAAASQLEIKYRTLQKDRQLMQKQLELTTKQKQLTRKNAWILGISAMSVLLALIMAGLYRNNRQQHRLQMERMRNLQQEQEIGNLKSMIRGEEKERSRLARELHDGILVLLSAIRMKLRGLPRQHDSLRDAAEYDELLTGMDHATRELRRTAHNLMPDMLLDGGIAEAVYYFCSNLQQSSGLSISFQQYGSPPRLQEEFELSIYRIVQELVQNILKHAEASKAIVQIGFKDDLLSITVEDNGIGFSGEKPAGQAGMGLRSIRNRVRALNGMMDLSSNEPAGTAIYLEFDIRSVIRKNNSDYADKISHNG